MGVAAATKVVEVIVEEEVMAEAVVGAAATGINRPRDGFLPLSH